MEILNFEKKEIRNVMIKGEPWFVAKDICDVLGLIKGRNSVALLNPDERMSHTMGVRSENGVIQDRDMTIVNESGMYNLIFQSRKPAAQRFRYWATSEVLPAIRKYGKYSLPGTAEQLKLEANYKKRKDAEWIRSIKAHFTPTDYDQIARKLNVDFAKVAALLENRLKDTTIEAECLIRAQRNAKLRKLLDDSEFRSQMIEEMDINRLIK